MSVMDAGVQTPRILHVPEYVSSAGVEAVELAALAGLHLDPWQQFVLQNSLGEAADGKWAATEVGLCVPRQNGKNEVLRARELAGLFLLGEELLIHTAQVYKTANEHFLRLLALIQDTPELSRRVARIKKAHGEEGIVLKNGQRILFLARSASSGRGFTAPFVAFDEAMFLPEKTIGALIPVQRTVENRQRWYTGSSVDQDVHTDGVVFARVRERGMEGSDPRLAYFEWSAEAERPTDVDMEMAQDPSVWAQANPSLGIRVTPEAFEDELRSLDLRTYAVEILGVGDWPDTSGAAASVISQEQWALLENTTGVLSDPVCLAFDVSPDRTCSIAAAGRNQDGHWQVEVVENKAGTGWVVERLNHLDNLHTPTMVVCDAYGPAASLLPALHEAGVKVTAINTTDHGQACGMFVDAVQQDTLRHLGSVELRNAVKGAAVRPLQDAWAWSRKNSNVDISPLVASTFALWAAETTDTAGDFTFYHAA